MSWKSWFAIIFVGVAIALILPSQMAEGLRQEAVWGMTWLQVFKFMILPVSVALIVFAKYAGAGKSKPSSGVGGSGKILNRASDKEGFKKDTPRAFLQTERGKFLDSRLFLYGLVHSVAASLKKEGMKGENETVQAQVKELLFAELADEHGVHIETVLTALGGIAGFSCQMMLREAYVDSGKAPENKVFSVFEGADGQKFFSGDNINEGLLEPRSGNLSVWSLVGGAPHSVGAPLPDVTAMVGEMAKSYGTPAFWVPNVPKEHMPNLMPKELLNRYWNIVRNIQMMNVGALSTMPFSIAQLAQKTILENKAIIDPTTGAKVVMDAALRMSRIDPKHVHFARFEQPV